LSAKAACIFRNDEAFRQQDKQEQEEQDAGRSNRCAAVRAATAAAAIGGFGIGLVIGDIGRDFGQRIGNRFRVSGGIVLDRIGHGLDRFHLTGFVDDAQADPLAITYIPIYDVRAALAAGRYEKSRIPECDNL